MIWLDEHIDRVICGDNREVMAQMPDECIDLIVTDPPYSLKFMGLKWDEALPSVATWKECLRVLKPGAFAFIMCIPRQDCQSRMIVNLQDAGFNVSFSPMYHAFAQGFPKAANISKMVDKRLGQEREVVAEADYSAPDIRGNSYDQEHVSERKRLPVRITAPGCPEACALDGSFSGFQPKPAVEVILVCQKPFRTRHRRSDVYRILGGKYDHWYTQRTKVTDKSQEKLEKKWGREFREGDIIERRLALRKGLEDQVIVNRTEVLWSAPYRDTDITSSVTHALETGKGVTWLEDCKIPYESQNDFEFADRNYGTGTAPQPMDWGNPKTKARLTPNGRFPANLLVSDDVLNDGINHQSGGIGIKTKSLIFFGNKKTEPRISGNVYNDSGSFSRYFSLDAWAQEHLPESVLKTFPFLLVPKPSKSEKTAGGRVENKHPTVKAIKLMAYLITMGSRPGDVVFDPYLGSGTTAVACVLKKRHFIGCDIDSESCKTAELRVEYAREIPKQERRQPDMFAEVAGEISFALSSPFPTGG